MSYIIMAGVFINYDDPDIKRTIEILNKTDRAGLTQLQDQVKTDDSVVSNILDEPEGFFYDWRIIIGDKTTGYTLNKRDIALITKYLGNEDNMDAALDEIIEHLKNKDVAKPGAQGKKKTKRKGHKTKRKGHKSKKSKKGKRHGKGRKTRKGKKGRKGRK